MSRKHKRKKKQEKVELNLAAMLDMAFQLLTFFIFSFKPDPREGQLNLRLPKPEAIAMAKTDQQAGQDTNNTDPVAGIESLVISIPSNSGNIGGILIGEGNQIGQTPGALNAWFEGQLAQGDFPFKQVIIQVGSQLRYSELMRVVDVCIRQTLPDGSKLTKMSFAELPEGG